MRLLKAEEVEDLMDDCQDIIELLEQDQDPEDALLIERNRMMYAALQELQVWRSLHPNEKFSSVITTEYGIQGMQ